MLRIVRQSFPLILMSGLSLWGVHSGACWAHGQESSSQQVDELERIYSQLPAETAAKRQSLLAAMAGLGPADLQRLCRSVVPAFEGGDAAARMVLEGIAASSSPELPRTRTQLVEAVIQRLQEDPPGEVKEFFVQLLETLAQPPDAARLGFLLEDLEVFESGVRLLVRLGSSEARAVLRRSLVRVQGPRRRASLILGLAQLGDRRSEAELIRIRREQSEHDLSVWVALASVAGHETYGLVYQALSKEIREGTSWTRGFAAQQLLGFAQRTQLRGVPDHQVREYLAPLFLCEDPHIKIAWLMTVVRWQREAAIATLLQLLEHQSKEVRVTAMQQAVALSGESVTDALIVALEDRTPRQRLPILEVLRQRKDRAARRVFLSCLESPEPAVRRLALQALPDVGGADIVAPLIRYLEVDRTPEERQEVRASLRRLRGEEAELELARSLTSGKPAARAMVLRALGDRRAVGQLDAIRMATVDAAPEVRAIAAEVLGLLGGSTDVPALVQGLLRDPLAGDPWGLALARVLRRSTDAWRVFEERWKESDLAARQVLLPVLARSGDGLSQELLVTVCLGQDQALRRAAVAALRQCTRAVDPRLLLELAGRESDAELHRSILQSALRLLEFEELEPRAQVEAWSQGRRVARVQEDRRRFLEGLARVDHVDAFVKLDQLAAEGPDVDRGEVLAALLVAIERWFPSRPRSMEQSLRRIQAAAPSPESAKRAGELLERLAVLDFEIDWWVSGPYSKAGVAGNDLLPLPFAPEAVPRGEVTWRPQPVTQGERYWLLDLARSVGGDHRVAYLATAIYSPQAQAAVLEFGSDDGIKVWLRGEVVHDNPVARGCGQASDRVSVQLESGWNDLLLKIGNLGGGWGASLRIRSPEGKSLPGVRTQADKYSR